MAASGKGISGGNSSVLEVTSEAVRSTLLEEVEARRYKPVTVVVLTYRVFVKSAGTLAPSRFGGF